MGLVAKVKLWFVRLFMLLWKDLLIRWRTSSIGCTHRIYGRIPIFLLIEILWPLVLYIIIVAMRERYPSHPHNKYIFQPAALPSAGTLPFLQSLMCDLDIESYNHYRHDLPTYPNAPINEIYENLADYSSLNVTLDSFCDAVHSLSDSADCLNRTSSNQEQCQGDSVPITCYLNDPPGFRTYLVSTLGISQSVADGILGATVDTSLFPDFLFPRGKRQNIPSVPSITPGQLETLVCLGNGTLLNSFVHFQNVTAEEVSQEICSLNSSQFSDLTTELQNQLSTTSANDCSPLDGLSALNSFQSARDLVDKFSNSDIFNGGLFNGDSNGGLDIDQATHFFCGNRRTSDSSLPYLLFAVLFGNDYQQAALQASGGNISLDSLPDKVRTKILYAPVTSHTQSIISRASKVLDTIDYFKNFSGQIVDCSNEFLTNFPPYSSQANASRILVDVLLGDYEGDTIIIPGYNNDQPLPTEYIDALNQFRDDSDLDQESLESLQRVLDPENPDNIWETVTKIRDVAKVIYDTLDVFDWKVFYPTESEEALEELAADYERQTELNFTTILAGVVFEGVEDGKPLTNATIKIRMNATNVVDPTDIVQTVWTPGPETSGWKKAYLWRGFMFIQDMVERALAEEIVGRPIPTPGTYVQEMPYPCYVHDYYMIAMEFVLPLAMLFSWLFPVAMTVRAIVREKETRLKEYIKMLGVSDSQIRISKVILSGAILMISVCFITLMLKVGGILPRTDWLIIFLYLCLYALVMLSYCFLVSTIFNNANLAACVASLVYFMVLFGHTVIVPKQQYMTPFTLGIACLWAPLGFAIGSQYMVQWEVQEVGLNWDNMNYYASTDSQLSFQAIAFILVLDTFLYFLLTWYIEGVAPGRYGVAKPLYFPFLPSYWLGQTGHDCCSRSREHTHLEEADDSVVCEEDPGLPMGISIENLTKVYRSWFPKRKKVTAVKDLSLNFFEGQITALLGHNGAGKTTTLSILAGLFEPTKGTAHIYGNDIRQHMDIIRQGLGICPQHNVLFDHLTVKEHLLFFGQLKGCSLKESTEQIPIWLSKVGLSCHANKLAKHLSGGMKRKLSILLAFVGGSKTIILDEPTAGVDPFARRGIWDFLLRQREGRTILLSTHHMDEAEILGDRIALLSSGSLLCCGSFEFLKARFASGHKLTLVTTPTSSVEGITEFINRFVVGSSLVETRGPELRYQLPIARARGTVLTQLFRSLEESKQELGVASYGLSAPALEEIFVDLTEKNATDDPDQASSETTPSEPASLEDSVESGEMSDQQELLETTTQGLPRLNWAQLWAWQFFALTVKRFHYTKRRLPALIVQNILPAGILLMSLFIAQALQGVGDPPPIELSPSLFFEVNRDNYVFVGGHRTPETEPFINSLFQPCGVGGHMTSHDPDHCFQGNGAYDSESSYECSDYPRNQTGQCTCHDGDDDDESFQCNFPTDGEPFENPPPICYNGTGTGSRVQDITGGNLADMSTYLLRTKRLNSTTSNLYVQARYGGVSFGHERTDFDESVGLDDLPFLAVKPVAKAWFTLKGRHAMPTYLNVLNNALLRGSLDPGKPQHMYGIKTISHPFKISELAKQAYAINEKNSFLVSPLAMMFSLGFVVAGFVLILIEERSNNVKHLQTVCGMNKLVYWLANITWDFVWYIGFLVIAVSLFLMFQDEFYTGSDTLPLFIVILLLYGISVTPWVYAFSFLFRSPATAYVTLFCLNFFGGFCVLIIDAIILYVNGFDNGEGGTLTYGLAAVPIPAYHLARCMMYLSSDYPLLKVEATFGVVEVADPWQELGPYLGAMIGHGAIFSIIVVVVEIIPFLRNIICRVRSSISSLPTPLETDNEVTMERARIQEQGLDCEDILSINGLSKVYRSERRWRDKRVAVNQLCLGVKKGQCFGLLGVNGAGKTTTFKMLTGDIRPSAGDAMISGRKLSMSHEYIGYCPQVDALIDQLTGRQHLVLFSALRGLHGDQLVTSVDWALRKLGLMEYADRPAGAYSGGNRRKLSTAIALLSQPALVLLDEPTSGVDPRARHFLWGVVNDLVREGQSVVLTTHSMAECEALCSRVAIMVNGELHCLGSPQQLKNTYGTGYRLKLRVCGELEPVKEFIRQNFEGTILKEEHYTTLVYQLPADLGLADVFETMEQARQTLDIQDYSVSQTTLDDVFIHFASAQSEEVGIINSNGIMELYPPTSDIMPDIIPLDPIETPDHVVISDTITQL